MKRIKCFIDRDKEERYLNEMARKGMAFCNLSCFNAYIPIGIYHFEKCEPNEYVYRLDIRNGTEDKVNSSGTAARDAEIESVVRKKNWEYLRRKGYFELYPDKSEQIAFYRKVQGTYRAFLVLLVFWLIARIAGRGGSISRFGFGEIVWLAGFVIVFTALLIANCRSNRKIKDLQEKDNHGI